MLKLFFVCVALMLNLSALACESLEDSSLELLGLLDRLNEAPLADNIGNSTMPISTQSATAQKYFNQGLSYLHGYWEFEALRAFRQAVRADPMAAMPYWGVYQAAAQMIRRATRFAQAAPRQLHNDVLQAALALASTASGREQMHIQAIADWHYKGGAAYLQALEKLLIDFPDDRQAQLLLAEKLRSETLLRKLIQEMPDDPAAHHYFIHTVEKSESVSRALASAERIAALAPGIAHIVHMPGHVFYRLGDYEKARQSFLATADIDKTYVRNHGVPALYHWNRVHNLFYLALNNAEQGRYREGLALSREAQALSREALVRKDYASGTFFDQGMLAPAKLEMRFGHWTRVLDELRQIEVDAAQLGCIAAIYYHALLDFAKAKIAFEQGDLASVKEAEAVLDELRAEAVSALQSASIPDWLTPVFLAMQLDLSVGVAIMEEDMDQAETLLEQAMRQEQVLLLGGGDPPRKIRSVAETAARIWLARNKWRESRMLYEKLLAVRPKNGFALLGLARSYDLAGERAQALAAYQQFLSVWRYADTELAAVQLAHGRIAELSR